MITPIREWHVYEVYYRDAQGRPRNATCRAYTLEHAEWQVRDALGGVVITHTHQLCEAV